MNGMPGGGGGYNTAFFAPGGPGYVPYAPPAIPDPVYTGTDPVIFSTDTPALIPQQPANDPVWFDPMAPLDLGGLNFPDEPVSAPAIESSPMIYDWQAPLDFGGLSFPDVPYVYPPSYIPEPITEGIVFPLGPVSPEISAPADFNWEDPVWFDPMAPLDLEGLVFADEPRTGPLESIWKIAGDVAKGIGDLAKFVVDNLDIGISYRGDFGGVKTQKAYYSTVGAPAPVILGIPGGAAPSVRTSVSTAGGGPAGGPAMTAEERLYREALGQTQADSDKFIMYAAGAYLAYRVFLK